MQLFYLPSYNDERVITLGKEESAHISRVLRYKEGQMIYLTDGKGKMMKATILQSDAKSCMVEVVDTQAEYNKPQYDVHIAFAPTKNINRIEWMVEKAVEMGVSELTPIITEHSERKTINIERLDKIIVSAMKQSIRAYKPILNNLIKFNDFLNQTKEQKKYVCYCGEGEKIFLKQDYKPKESSLIMIGPEGDFSEAEVQKAKANDCKLITLGNMRLRTETAALYALANICFINQ